MNRRALLLSLAAAAGTVRAAGNLPRPSPDYTLKFANGTTMPLSKYKGKVIVIEFLLTTCPHCQETSKMLQKVQQEYAAKGVQVLGVAVNDTVGRDAAEFMKTYGLSFPVGACPTRESVNEYLQLSVMDRMYMPQLVFIDRNFTIQAHHTGTDAFLGPNQEKNVRGMLDKMTAASTTKSSVKTPRKPS